MSGSIFDRDRLTQRPQLDMSSITQMATRGGRAGRSAAATIIGGAQAQNQFNQTENALALGQDALGLRRDELAQQQTQFDTTGERLDDQMAQGAITGLRGGLSQPVASSVGSALGTPATGVSSSALGQPNTTPRPIFGSSSPAGMDYDPLSRRPGMQNGGRIGDPRRDNGQDTVPVMARQGEYYLNPETVQHLGGGDYSKGLRGLNSLVREATGKEPGPTPPDKNGLRGYADSGVVRKGMYTDANQELVDGALTTGRAIQQGAFPQTAAAFGRVGDDTNAAYQNRGAGAAIGTAVNRAVKVPVGVAKDVGASTMRVVTPAVEFAGDLSGALMGDNTPVATQPARPTQVPGQVSPQAPKQGARALPQRSPEEEFRARHAGADQYRDAWQGRTKGGLRNADSDAVRLYNAEQQARGTGVRAQRQANGTMSFGDGGVTAPQYLSANGTPTNDWKDTSQYRDAVMRNLGSSDKGLRRSGLAMAKDLELRDKPYDPEAQFKTAEALQRLELGQQNLAQGAQQLSAGKANALNSAFDRLGVPPDMRAIVMQNIGPGLSEMSPNESEAAVAKTLMDLEALGVANAASIGGVTSNRMPTNIGLRRPNWGEVRFGGPDDENPNAFGVIDYLTGGDKQVAEDGVIDSSGNRQVLRAINVARAREASKKNLDTLTRLGIK